MTKRSSATPIATGVRNLDQIFGEGIPRGSAIILGGPPGSGKTILTQQICFHNASKETPVLYFSTLSEPTAKTLRYLKKFDFFDPKKLADSTVQFVDLGVILRAKGLEEASALVMDHVKRAKPAIVVIDSFKVFDDLAKSRDEIRKFAYELVVRLMAWECTVFLLGEYGTRDYETNPIFSIIDGLLLMNQRESSGEQQRYIQLHKMRGTNHSRDEHAFSITRAGIEIFAPRVTIRREPVLVGDGPVARLKTGIARLDDLLDRGIPRGFTILVAGVPGTGKTVLLLEFIYKGAQAGEKGIVFSFEETEERLRATARGLGWDLDPLIERGLVEIVFIPQPEIMVEAHLLMIQERIAKLGARRVALDSASVFLHKIKDPQINREKVFQLASIIHNAQAVGFFATDVSYGTQSISRFGVEETVVDGVFILTSSEEGLERQRYIEVYKVRNTAHLKGRHAMNIGPGGITVYPRYRADEDPDAPPPSVSADKTLSSGIEGLDRLLGGGFLERSVTVVSGSTGIGKSTLGVQFLLAGEKRREKGLYVTLEEGPDQILRSADSLGLPLRRAVEKGLVEIVYLGGRRARPSEFLAVMIDRIKAQGARRLVLDSTTEIDTSIHETVELPRLLNSLVRDLKRLDVTTIFTIESKSMYSTSTITGRGVSPVADNILLLRYARAPEGLARTFTVVKTRGRAHDSRTHRFTIAEGGIHLEAPEKRKKKRP